MALFNKKKKKKKVMLNKCFYQMLPSRNVTSVTIVYIIRLALFAAEHNNVFRSKFKLLQLG